MLIWNLEDHDGGSWLSASKKKAETLGPAKYTAPAPTLAPRFKLKVRLRSLPIDHPTGPAKLSTQKIPAVQSEQHPGTLIHCTQTAQPLRSSAGCLARPILASCACMSCYRAAPSRGRMVCVQRTSFLEPGGLCVVVAGLLSSFSPAAIMLQWTFCPPFQGLQIICSAHCVKTTLAFQWD